MNAARKKPSAIEIADEAAQIDAIRTAKRFLASVFAGVGQYEQASALSVLAAVQIGAGLEAMRSGGQRAMIYAVQEDGHAVFISRSTIEKLVARYYGKDL